MTNVSHLGGGFTTSTPDPGPAATAIRGAAAPGSPAARLIVLAGPPGVGKTAVARTLLPLLPHAFLIDKDQTAAGFILEAADDSASAYGTPHYWQTLRPLEYAGPLALACTNLVDTRQVLLVGGFGPELGLDDLWPDLRDKIAPANLVVLHLDAPPLATWRARMAQRGSRTDDPYFTHLAQTLGTLPIHPLATRIDTDAPLHTVVQRTLDALAQAQHSTRSRIA